jgi:hypothetical protein
MEELTGPATPAPNALGGAPLNPVLFDGKQNRVLTVVDTFMRDCPVTRVWRSATAMVLVDA